MTDADKVPKPIVPGPEMEALDRFYPDVTWTGTIEAGGMGPGTPAQTAKGRGKRGRHPGRALDRRQLRAGPAVARRHVRASLAASLGGRLGPHER